MLLGSNLISLVLVLERQEVVESRLLVRLRIRKLVLHLSDVREAVPEHDGERLARVAKQILVLEALHELKHVLSTLAVLLHLVEVHRASKHQPTLHVGATHTQQHVELGLLALDILHCLKTVETHVVEVERRKARLRRSAIEGLDHSLEVPRHELVLCL